MRRIAERILLTLWVGGLWTIGYLAVPILFATLDDRMLAGMVAGKMFTAMSYIGIACGVTLGAINMLRWDLGKAVYQRLGIIVSMLVLVLIGEFVLQPQMAQLKLEGIGEGTEQAARFATLHGIASILYLLTSVGGLVLVILGSAGRERPTAA